MHQKGKLAVFFVSAVFAIYGIGAAFYGKVVATDDAYPALSVFMHALSKIEGDYVVAPDMDKVQEGAMRGLIAGLDPYSCFLTKDQFEALAKRKANGTTGIGVVLSKRAEIIYVVSARRNSAAEEAGIRPGDYIIAVDGTSVEDRSILEAESLLRGPEGSKVEITVFRNTRTEPAEMVVERREGNASPAGGRLLENNVGLLEVSSLDGNALDEARIKLKTLISAGAQSLLLDLRDCADGEASDGAELANCFLDEGVIFTSKNRAGGIVQEVKADRDKLITKLPLAVLVNGSTAGAAEIAAGALSDHKRATLVGERTFGSGSQQKQIQLDSGAVLILSTAKYYTPSGQMIQHESVRRTGIKPDIQAPDGDTRQDLLVESYYDEKEEVEKYRELREKIREEQLDRALEALRSLQPQRKVA